MVRERQVSYPAAPAQGAALAAREPFWGSGFGLVSLKELLMPEEEFQFGRIANIFYFLGRLDEEGEAVSQRDRIQIAVMAELCRDDLKRFGLHASLGGLDDLIAFMEGTHPSTNLRDHLLVLRTQLMTELKGTLFLPVESRRAQYYREPRSDWAEVIDRFPETVSDIEEAGRCYALGRYAASVFHSMQVMEHGLLALGEFLEVSDPKSGFTAVANALQKFENTKDADRSALQQEHAAFLEQMNASVQAIKDAWRNKVSHAQGKLVIMTADFSPAVTEEIYVATRGFMRRLATELPEPGRRWPFRG